ncbi:MAG: cytochrome c [Chloroflexi bacterium]|nr:cytochrome c [Chloroflexota bacterium]
MTNRLKSTEGLKILQLSEMKVLVILSVALMVAACSAPSRPPVTPDAAFSTSTTSSIGKAPPALDGKVVQRGQVLYQQYCASCHGVRGEGQPNWKIPKEDGIYPAPPHMMPVVIPGTMLIKY